MAIRIGLRAALVAACLATSTYAAKGDTMRRPGDVVISNRTIQATVNATTGLFTLVDRATGAVFVRNGRTDDGGVASVTRVPITTPILGRGTGVRITRVGGRSDTLALYPSLPFALLQAGLRNGTDGTATISQVTAAALPLDLGRPIASLAALGTGGLHACEGAPGSYMWMAVAEPVTRAGVVGGWLSSRRGSGVVLASADGNQPVMTAQIDYGKLLIAPGGEEALETFAIGRFTDARLGLEAWAGLVARMERVKLKPQPSGYCTWYHAGASDEKQLAEQARFAARELGPFGFTFAQIDDGWQDGVSHNGPNRIFGRARPNGPYPSGMKAMADQLRTMGLTAGIWFMPFAGTHYDPFFADKQEWFVRRADGMPYETDWGGTCLDMTHPDARAYLRANAAMTAHQWGYHYFKMDGLWTGTATKQQYVNDAYRPDGIGDATFHDPSKTNIETYRSGLALVREAAGPGVFLLGCCAPQNMRSYGATFGLVDAMRIGPDNGPDWGGMLTGPSYGSRQYFLNGRVWWNDPDPVYVRPSVPIAEARALCSWAAVSGQLTVCSDGLPGLEPERLDILKRIMPAHGLHSRPVDLFDQPIARVWTLKDDRPGRTPRTLVGLFNWSDHPTVISEPADRLGLDPATVYSVFDYWANRRLPDLSGKVEMTVPGRSCAVLSLVAAASHPQLLGTNRHVTQGAVDLLADRWVAAEDALVGRSRVVGGDAYELRIAAQGGRPAVSVSPTDARAGVTIECRQEEGLARVVIRSRTSRTVTWQVRGLAN